MHRSRLEQAAFNNNTVKVTVFYLLFYPKLLFLIWLIPFCKCESHKIEIYNLKEEYTH